MSASAPARPGGRRRVRAPGVPALSAVAVGGVVAGAASLDFAPSGTDPTCGPSAPITVKLKGHGRKAGKCKIVALAKSTTKPRRIDKDTLTLTCSPTGGGQATAEAPAVEQALDIDAEGSRLRLGDHVVEEVADLEVGLIADRHAVREADAARTGPVGDGREEAGEGVPPRAAQVPQGDHRREGEPAQEEAPHPLAPSPIALPPAGRGGNDSPHVLSASGRISGKRITSRIDCRSAISIVKRSMPTPMPAAGGMACSRART